MALENNIGAKGVKR